MNIINQELEKVLKLLLQEKEEDLEQFKHKLANTSLKARRNEGVCWYPVSIDQTKYSEGEKILIKVTRTKEHKESHMFQSGKLVSLFSNAGKNSEQTHSLNGIVNYARDHEMMITVNVDDLPDWIQNDKLGVQLLFDENSYVEMERAMKIVLDPQDDRLVYLKNVLLGDFDALFTENKEVVKLPQLNESQNKALSRIKNAQDVAIVHGPPGTGKTTTLVECILLTLKNENQVLVCAPSNAAIDLLSEKLIEKGISLVRIGHPARVTDELLTSTLDAQVANHQNYSDLKAVKKQTEEYRRTALKYKRNFGPEEREQRRLLLTEVSRMRKEADQLEYYIINDVLSKAQVIASTLVGAANHNIRDKKYSTVFIDEAAQSLEPASWIPITKANRVVFAGDHCQLPPTIKSYKAAQDGLINTLFEKAIKRNKVDVMLTEQYRMHKNIMGFSGKYFYKNKLQANDAVKEWLMFAEDQPLEFVDTAGCGYFEEQDTETRSTFNKEEADLVLRHFKNYFLSVDFSQQKVPVSVGVIAPYKAQVSLLQDIFKGVEEDGMNLSVNTIDSFQGQERDVIYISLVRSNEKGDIGFLSDVRRMNVAMTRAKKKLVVIGDSGTIGQNEFYASFLDYVNEINAYRSAFEFMSY